MTPVRLAVLTAVIPSLLFAQHLTHPLGTGTSAMLLAPPDTLKILAVMVQFATDADSKTTGDGHFLLTARADSVIDAPPHNRAYFEQHLTFAGNYFRKASRGKLIVSARVVDSVFTLPAKMSAYSPVAGGSDSVLTNLARDTWKMVDASGRVTDFSRYGCFMIFHAGAGRDVDLVSLYQADPTPYDIPSITLGISSFQNAYGSNSRGIPVQGGAFFITNSSILPETESRDLPTVTGSTYLELGINGLLCASVGSTLGLPDLFDTKTGRSGIGRFGLMDGQGIFSFYGVFPPEPSAWEKITLGWARPIDVAPGTTVLRLPAGTANDTIYRVRFSPTEYFLLENRNRDPLRNGQTITSVYNGVVRTQRFVHDTTGFEASDISGLAGVITDVEDFDWSLPGGVGENNEWFDGGILIWHIDEAVINAGLSANTVNADPEHRGVDLEEADGSQDIGQLYEDLFAAGAGSESGTALDFWYKGNASPVNTNQFAATTFPDSRSNAGAQSHVSIVDFSARGPVMSASVTVGDGGVYLERGFPRSIGSSSSGALQQFLLQPKTLSAALVTAAAPLNPSLPGLIFAVPADGSRALPGFRSDGAVASTGAAGVSVSGRPALRDINGDSSPDLVFSSPESPGSTAGLVSGVSLRTAGSDSLGTPLFTTRCASVTTTPLITDSLIALPSNSGVVYFLRLNGTLLDSLGAAAPTAPAWASAVYDEAGTLAIANGSVLRLISGRPSQLPPIVEKSRDFVQFIEGAPLTGRFRANGVEKQGIVFTTFGGSLYLVDQELQTFPGFPINLGVQTPCSALALGDIDQDGARDIVVFRGGDILAFNSSGAMLDHFPVRVAESQTIAGASSPPGGDFTVGGITTPPVIADVDGNDTYEILGGTANGQIFAISPTGKNARGFPVACGTFPVGIALYNATPVGLVDGSLLGLCARTLSADVMAWTLAGGRGGPWPQIGHDGGNSNVEYSTLNSAPLSGEYLPKARAYNWPNPTYDGKTYLRYFVKENAAVTITILDLAGDRVAELTATGVGGVDNEILWNAAGVQSGIYFAHIQAQGQNGSGETVVKIAVVR